MEIYLISIFLIFLFGVPQIYSNNWFVNNKYLTFILYLVFVITIGLRWETGVDWNSYLSYFESISDIESALFYVFAGYEIGYGILVLAFKNFSTNYSLFLLVHAIVFYWGIFRMAKKYSPFFLYQFFYITQLI